MSNLIFPLTFFPPCVCFFLRMSQRESKDRLFFTDISKYTLKKKGIKVSSGQLTDFLQFVQTVSLWFLDQATLDVETWYTIDI